jgi:hypothetical protein
MSFSAKTMLENLDRFFREAGVIEGNKLWDVLSALRGPDDMGIDKYNTTAIIRKHAFPSCGVNMRGLCDTNDAPLSTIKEINGAGASHFDRHLVSARNTLLAMYPEAPAAAVPLAAYYAPVARPPVAGPVLVTLGKIQD